MFLLNLEKAQYVGMVEFARKPFVTREEQEEENTLTPFLYVSIAS